MARLNYPTSFRSNARMSLTKFVNDSCDPVVSRDCFLPQFLSSIGPISRQNRATCFLLTAIRIFPFFRFKILKRLVLGFRIRHVHPAIFLRRKTFRFETTFFFFFHSNRVGNKNCNWNNFDYRLNVRNRDRKNKRDNFRFEYIILRFDVSSKNDWSRCSTYRGVRFRMPSNKRPFLRFTVRNYVGRKLRSPGDFQ